MYVVNAKTKLVVHVIGHKDIRVQSRREKAAFVQPMQMTLYTSFITRVQGGIEIWWYCTCVCAAKGAWVTLPNGDQSSALTSAGFLAVTLWTQSRGIMVWSCNLLIYKLYKDHGHSISCNWSRRSSKNWPFKASFFEFSPLSKSKNEGSIGSAVGSSWGSWYGCRVEFSELMAEEVMTTVGSEMHPQLNVSSNPPSKASLDLNSWPFIWPTQCVAPRVIKTKTQ